MSKPKGPKGPPQASQGPSPAPPARPTLRLYPPALVWPDRARSRAGVAVGT
jgi:hypothetical protein